MLLTPINTFNNDAMVFSVQHPKSVNGNWNSDFDSCVQTSGFLIVKVTTNLKVIVTSKKMKIRKFDSNGG